MLINPSCEDRGVLTYMRQSTAFFIKQSSSQSEKLKYVELTWQRFVEVLLEATP